MLDNEKSFTVTDSKGEKHIVEKLSADDFNWFEQQGIKCNDNYLAKGINIYETNDGKVIVQESGNYALYPSLQVLDDILRNLPKNSTKAIMYNKIRMIRISRSM